MYWHYWMTTSSKISAFLPCVKSVNCLTLYQCSELQISAIWHLTIAGARNLVTIQFLFYSFTNYGIFRFLTSNIKFKQQVVLFSSLRPKDGYNQVLTLKIKTRPMSEMRWTPARCHRRPNQHQRREVRKCGDLGDWGRGRRARWEETWRGSKRISQVKEVTETGPMYMSDTRPRVCRVPMSSPQCK